MFWNLLKIFTFIFNLLIILLYDYTDRHEDHNDHNDGHIGFYKSVISLMKVYFMKVYFQTKVMFTAKACYRGLLNPFPGQFLPSWVH